MAFKLNGASPDVTKVYLQPVADGAAPGSRQWEYVTTDAPGTVDGSGYIDNTTEDGEIAIAMLGIGDLVWVYQVSGLDDTRPISEDKKAGITDLSLHLVLDNTGSIIDLSDDLLGVANLTYGD